MDTTAAVGSNAGPQTSETPDATPASSVSSGRRVEVVPDLRPSKRHVNRDFRPLDSGPLANGLCPLCRQGFSWTGYSRAHVVPKGHGGDDVPENAAYICGDGTRGCHGVLTHRGRGTHGLTYEQVAPAFVRYCRETVPQLGEYADGKKYDGWLEVYYLGALQAAA